MRLVSADGLSAEAVIDTQSANGYDGGTISSMQTPIRNPSFILRFRGADVESQQIRLNRIFRPKNKGVMTFVGRLGTVQLNYTVESLLIPPNAYPLQAQLALKCEDPYFYAKSDKKIVIAGIKSLFQLPFSIPAGVFKISRATSSVFTNITNNGEAETGVTIRFVATATVKNPALINAITSKAAKVNYTMLAGDEIVITTGKGNKSITLIRDGVETNLFNNKAYPFTFIQLPTGTTMFKYEADEGEQNLLVTVTFRERFTACYTEAAP